MSIPGSGSPLLLATTAAAADAAYVIPKSLRFNSADSASLSTTIPDITTFSFSFWYKHVAITRNDIFVTDSSYGFFFYQHTDGSFRLNNNYSNLFISNGLYRDPSAWYHLLLTNDGTTLKLYVNGVLDKAQTVGTYLNAGGLYIGRDRASAANHGDFLLADAQFVDGQALAPTDFGETRSSDGVWVPKEYTGSYGPAIDQTQTWSSAAADSYGFDGSTAYNSAATRLYGTSTYHKIVDANNSFTNVTSVVVGTSENVGNIKLDGTVYTTSYASGVGLTVTSPPSSFSDIEVLGASNGVQIAYVKISGVLLVDAGVTISHNGFHLNFSDSSTNEALGFDSAPTIPDADPKKGMDVVTYTGNGGTQNIGGLNFEPGLIWLKSRSEGARSHSLYDNVRGVSKVLKADNTDSEVTMTGVTSFNPDGFTLGSHVNSNNNTVNYVAWTWRAGGPAVANTDGTINSQVSANTDYGFSIVSYTGTGSAATIGHGLTNQTPKFVIVKDRDGSSVNWRVYHASTGNGKALFLSANEAPGTSTNYWNDTSPTTSLFSVGTDTGVNTSGNDNIAYCWSEVSGFSKFGSYTGNGSTTGPVITTGFKVRWLLVKRTNAADDWCIYDTERDPSNPRDTRLEANTDDAEVSGTNIRIDFLDDGFQPVGTGSTINNSGSTYIYAAFADRPGNNWDVNNIVTNEGLTTSKTQFDVVTYTGNGGTQKIGGPVYSAGATATGGFNSSYPATNLFNGTLSDSSRAEGNSNDGVIEVVFSPGIAVSSTVGIWSGKSSVAYQINDSGSYTTYSDAVGSFKDISFTGTLTNLKIKHGSSGNAPGASGIRVDSTTLLDGTGPGLKFKPDFVWYKHRSGASSHGLFDSVRGATKYMNSNGTGAEQTVSGVTSFNDDGFTLGSDSGGNGSGSWVAWCWKAGGTAVSNTDGSITSSVSANAAYGFSIVSYTGNGTDNATFGHGLNKVPELIIVKNRSSADDWFVYTKPTEDNILQLNTTGTKGASSHFRTMTSSTFQLSGNADVNANNSNFIAYCFANVPGYQRVGSYTGNGSSTGPVIVTGFKPRFLMIKNTSQTGPWYMYDSERDNAGNNDKLVQANDSTAEFTSGANFVDFQDSGFQPKGTGGDTNGSGKTYIYWAIGDDEIGSDEDCLVDVPNAVTADADATDTTGGYQRGNYCVLNPLDTDSSGKVTLSNGNLTATGNSNRYGFARGTIGVTSGKYYFEASVNGNNAAGIGVCEANAPDQDALGDRLIATAYRNYVYCGSSLQIFINGSSVYTGSAVADGDIIGVAVDVDAGKVWFSQNGVYQGSGAQDPGAGAGGYSPTNIDSATPLFQDGGGSPVPVAHFNFGQMRFKYPMPSGYAALNTTALPAATIADGSDYFKTAIWSGNSASSRTITTGFDPDWVWVKNRGVAGRSHYLYDAVRGFGANKEIVSNTTDEEGSSNHLTQNHGYVSATTSTGFTLAAGATNSNYTNQSGQTYVGWAWDAGSSTVSNTDGSITSSVRANPSAGFSIISYTGNGTAGATVGHGLNAKPDVLIIRNRDRVVNWGVYHSSVGATKFIALNLANAATAWTGFLNNTEPTSSVITLGNGSGPNHNGENIIIYAMSAVAGYSAFGSYVGNGSTDGPFVYTGFRPAALLWKPDQGSTDWVFVDAERNTYNVIDDYLLPNTNGAEGTLTLLDFCSNGFKLRTSSTGNNTSGTTVVYMAWAENPFQANGGLAR